MGGDGVTLGLARRHGDLFDPVVGFCDEQLGESSIYGLLHRERDRLFPDEMFADLYQPRGRRSVPPSVLACVLVLQRLEGLSDREAVDRFTYDARWRYACGVGGWESGWTSFNHSVLVRFRMRLEGSADPRRIFAVSTAVAAEAGLIGIRRVLDSAPLFDAVATQDTVTLIRSAIRGLLRAADLALGARLRAVLCGEDDYAGAGKPPCDWDDSEARTAVVDRLARDGLALLGVLETRPLSPKMAEAAELLALVIGQDLEQTDDGTFRIARKVAKDRIISTVDRDARHGHKTTARRFDGYKGHIAADPDSEIVTDTAVGPANGGDGHMTDQLTADLDPVPADEPEATSQPNERDPQTPHDTHDNNNNGDAGDADGGDGDGGGGQRPAVYGDAAYGSGDNLAGLARRGIEANTKVQPPASRGGRFTKDAFRHRSRSRHRVVSGRAHHDDPSRPQRRRHRPLRWQLPHLSAAVAVHHRQGRTGHHRLTSPTAIGPRPQPTARPRLACRLPRDPPEGRTQTRAHAAARPACQTTWPSQSRCRLELPRRSGQLRPHGPPRATQHRRKLADRPRLAPHRNDPPRPIPPRQHPDQHPGHPTPTPTSGHRHNPQPDIPTGPPHPTALR
jgi:hypothetical protein